MIYYGKTLTGSGTKLTAGQVYIDSPGKLLFAAACSHKPKQADAQKRQAARLGNTSYHRIGASPPIPCIKFEPTGAGIASVRTPPGQTIAAMRGSNE